MVLIIGKHQIEITEHPQSQDTVYGNEVALTVSATGPDTLSYQWMKDGDNITGECTPTLHIESFSSQHDGDYVCRVSHNGFSVTSNSAKIKGANLQNILSLLNYGSCKVLL